MVRDDRRPTDAHLQALVPRGSLKSEREEIGAIRHQADRVTSSRLHICNRQRFRRKSAAEVRASFRVTALEQRQSANRQGTGCTPGQGPRRQGRPHRRGAAAHAEDRGQSRWAAPRGLRRLSHGLLADRAQLFRDIPTGPFFGFNRPAAKVSQGPIDNWWRQGMMCGVKAAYDCIKAFSETAEAEGNGRALGGLALQEMEDT
jgi:hypothetical protein